MRKKESILIVPVVLTVNIKANDKCMITKNAFGKSISKTTHSIWET
jgi:hypothetical protein